jgi:hypothetical protein
MTTPSTRAMLAGRIEQANDPESKAACVNDFISDFVSIDHNSVFWGDRLLTLDKSAGFLKDPQFFKAFQSILGNHVYDQYSGPQSVAWRLHTLVWAATEAMHLDGDFMECGTFKGDFAWVITQCVDIPSRAKRLYLYDSFDGLDDSQTREDDYVLNPNYAKIANEAYQEPGIYEHVCKRFKDMPHVEVTKGFLPGMLTEVCPEKISFLHIDLNSPEAERATLSFLWPRIVDGGIVVFDDYGWLFFEKQKAAVDAVAEGFFHTILELPSGQGLLVKRASV